MGILNVSSLVSGIVSADIMYWVPLLTIFLVGVFGLGVATFINRKTSILTKIPSTVWAFIPAFTPFILLLLPMVFTNVDIFIVLIVVGCTFVFLAAFAFINIRVRFQKRYFLKKEEKTEQIIHEKKTTFK